MLVRKQKRFRHADLVVSLERIEDSDLFDTWFCTKSSSSCVGGRRFLPNFRAVVIGRPRVWEQHGKWIERVRLFGDERMEEQRIPVCVDEGETGDGWNWREELVVIEFS